MIIEPRSSVFILRRDRERGWLAALVWHPRLECWLAAGGHVESNETAAHCGVREALEETGLDVTLVPGPAAPVPAGFPRKLVPAPWLVAEVRAAPDRHTGEPHIHEDHVYVATTASPRPVRQPEHQVRWFTQARHRLGTGHFRGLPDPGRRTVRPHRLTVPLATRAGPRHAARTPG